MDRVTDDDLLALIEGELSEERVPIVETALRADPALVERIRRMRTDREGLRELAKSDRAPAGLVCEAMSRADRTRLVQMDTGGPVRASSLARGSRGRRVQMAVAAVLALGALGVWAWLTVLVSGSSGDVVAQERRPVRIVKPEREGSEAGQAGEAPDVGPEAAEAEAPSLAPVLAGRGNEDAGDPLLEQWLANLGGEERGLDYAAAADLALRGRLRVEVEGGGPHGLAVAADGTAGSRLESLQLLRAESGVDERCWWIELRYRPGLAREDLAFALEETVRELEARTGRRVRLEEAGEADAEARPRAASDASSILWWAEPASEWTRRMVVRVPIAFVDG